MPFKVLVNIGSATDVAGAWGLAAAFRVAWEAVGPTLQDCSQFWVNFLKTAGHPVSDCEDAADMEWLDVQVVRFASSDERQLLEIADVTKVERLWLHMRAEQLGMTSETVQRQGCSNVAMLRLRKPHGWLLPAAPLRTVPRQQQAPRRRRQRRLRCTRCCSALTETSALYRSDGWGPLCAQCKSDQGTDESDDY
jgi:hypothetical protein